MGGDKPVFRGSTIIPPEISKGIRDTIGRKMSVTLKKMVKLERSQGDKVDAKVLTLTPDRCFILGVKAPFKVENNFHFLEIKAMDSPSPDRLIISTTNGKIFFMQMIGTDDADHIIGRVALSLRTIFPGVSLSKIMKASLEPLHRQKLVQSMLNQADLAESGPCGNFSVMYECMCNYLGLPVREEVGWDVDTIYLSQNCKDLNFKDFDLPEQRDFIPIISVLRFNKWFEGLTIRNVRLSSEVFEAVLKAVRQSTVLRQLILEGVGLKGEVAHRLSQEMIENKECCIEHLDLSNNPLEDRAIMHLSGALPLLRHSGGLKMLKMDRTGLSAKGVSGLCQALRSSSVIGRTLTTLVLSDNSIKGEEAVGLYNYLSSKNHLEHLDVSGTDCAVEIYISAFSKGCLEHLKTVDLSRNHFYGKKQKETALPNTFQAFFKMTQSLSHFDISGMKIPPEAVRQIVDGLLQNYHEDLQVYLNFSNGELKSIGAQMISQTVAQLTNVVGLDLTDNGLDAEITTLLGWIQQNRSIRELKIGKNFNGIKPKYMKAVMDSVVQLVQEEGSCLEHLSLCDSKLREWTSIILACLGSNTSLVHLDISGNFIGDTGARVLAKALQINSKLRFLLMDRNMVTAAGYHEISGALEKNFTLRHLPYPIQDAMGSMKNQPEKMQSSLAKIQELLRRNTNSNKNSNEQQFRLQRAVTCTAQEVLDRVAEKVDDAVNALELLEADSACSDVVVKAKGLVKDAKNSKQLLSDIYGLGMEKTAGDHSQLRRKLEQMAREMDSMVKEHIQNTVKSMTTNAEAQCPHIFESISGEIDEKTKEKSHLPKSFVQHHVTQTTGTEIINKVSELNLAVATLISDKVTDTLLAALSQCNSTLTEQLNKQKAERAASREEYKRPSSSVPKEENYAKQKEKAEKQEEREEKKEPEENGAVVPQEEEKKPISATENILPMMRQERAASIAKRKQRPISNVGLDLEYKDKTEVHTPPRSVSPIPEPAPEEPPAENGADSPPDEPVKDEIVKEEEPVYAKLNKKEKKKEEPEEKEEEEQQEEEESKDQLVIEEEEDEMMKETKEEVNEDETDHTTSNDMDFSELAVTDTKKLEHVTKGRARPTRRNHRRPAKTETQAKNGVDEFFTSTIESTDFENVPSFEEEKEMVKEEAKEEKKTPKRPQGVPGMPGMVLTPDMLKRKKKTTEANGDAPTEEEKEDPKTPEEKNGEENAETEEEKPEPTIRKKPPGAMGMGLPGMGFGGNVLAEMKLKRLNKSKSPESSSDKKEEEKSETPLPFGRSMLKKTNPVADKNENNNNNNSKEWTSNLKTTPNRWKSRSFGNKERPEINVRPDKAPLMPDKDKASPPSAISRSGVKGKPPPLPTKPKPATRRSGGLNLDGGKSRPVSEFVDPSRVPSSVRLRAASWGKTEKKEETENK